MLIKICGLTNPKEADYLNKNHVDFAGFVLFFPKSKRNVTIKTAKEIMKQLSQDIKKVAVVVSPTKEQAIEICNAGFDYIQIHGDLSEELLDTITIPILKAFNVKDMGQYKTYRTCDKIAGYVFDAQEPGSGKNFDWNLCTNIPRDEKLFLLAGGLYPENVGDAIKALHPDGVDVSSGVEFDKEITGKDPNKVDAFVAAVRETNPLF
ncbi:MAG: phosphoribosylanthranilate isomerase [Lachnospiraceae bacterium]|nr:phosphoribosylanthranilate isomerase [Lachnospiraceae bacterium]